MGKPLAEYEASAVQRLLPWPGRRRRDRPVGDTGHLRRPALSPRPGCAGGLTVVAATNIKREDRAKLVQLARDRDDLSVTIVLDCRRPLLSSATSRPIADMNAGVIWRQRADLRRGQRGLDRSPGPQVPAQARRAR